MNRQYAHRQVYPRVTHETAQGIVVTLEQVADINSHGTVYVLSSSLQGERWGYGRGDTECIESLHGYRPFHLLAEKYIAAAALLGEES
jgi:hypothetical protein